jgi:hypothetical protein
MDAIEKVFAKSSCSDQLFQVFVGSGDHSCIHFNKLISAQRIKSHFFKNPQKLGLHIRRHLRDLIQKEGPVVGLGKKAFPALLGSSKGPFSKPKSSLSNRFSGIAAQLIATNGPFSGARQMQDFAINSFPVPLSTDINGRIHLRSQHHLFRTFSWRRSFQ